MTQTPSVTVGKKWDKGAIYIGRPSIFGNPFPVPSRGAEHLRDSACDQYEAWFQRQLTSKPGFVNALESLVTHAKDTGQLVLGCYCSPKRCHGETIKAYVEARLSGALQRPEPEDNLKSANASAFFD